MKHQLPLMDLITEKNSENEIASSQRDEINSGSKHAGEAKNINYIRSNTKLQKRTLLKPITDQRDLDPLNLRSSRATNSNNLNDYKDLKPISSYEERNNLINLNSKSEAVASVSENVLALRKLKELEERKKKIENEKLKSKETSERKALKKIRGKLENFVESNYVVVFFMVLTIFIMFIGDIQNGWLPATSDDAIDALQTVILVLFTIEIVITCFAKEGYLNSFFFWLDVVSTVSIIQDIGFMFDPLLNIGSSTSSE